MLKLSSKQWLFVILGVAVPTAIFVAARSAASWRPQLAGRWKDTVQSDLRDSHYLHLSPDERWLVCEGEGYNSDVLFDLKGEHLSRHLGGANPVFSSDSRFIATYQYPELFLYEGPHLKWRVQNSLGSSPPQGRRMSFVDNDSRLRYNTYNWGKPFKREAQFKIDIRTGRELSPQDMGIALWQQVSVGKSLETIRQKISRIDPASRRPLYSFQTSNAVDIWRLSPDGMRIWIALGKQNRFNILDAKTGRRLWSLSTVKAPVGTTFQSYPSWEEGGKTLAIIEKDALVLRDGCTGKVLLRHQNNLPAPLRSWVFTGDRNAVYLLNDKGDIYRQRLR